MITQKNILDLLSLIKPHTPACGLIRVGSAGDGGYVIPDDLKGVDAVISIGIGKEVSFDKYFSDRKILQILLE
jgi:hypothetical protein